MWVLHLCVQCSCQVCRPWMTPHAIGSLAHVQYRVSWGKRFRGPGMSWNFSKQESGNPVHSTGEKKGYQDYHRQ